jgi:pimeloyl-ACP methyl ester carboxylesterase
MTREAAQNRSLLFLPGTGADPEFWRPVGERLPGAWSKVYLGWPGIGHNPPAPEVRSFADLVALAERKLLELAQRGTKIDLVAQSMGGAIALALALEHPRHVRRMVLTVTAGGMDVEAFGAEDWRPGYRQEYPEAATWLYEARPDYSTRLSEVTVPALLVWGEDDPISPVAVGKEFLRLLPHAELVVIPGGTHAVALERPDEVSELVLRHLSGD